jgi:hypothetical protein
MTKPTIETKGEQRGGGRPRRPPGAHILVQGPFSSRLRRRKGSETMSSFFVHCRPTDRIDLKPAYLKLAPDPYSPEEIAAAKRWCLVALGLNVVYRFPGHDALPDLLPWLLAHGYRPGQSEGEYVHQSA